MHNVHHMSKGRVQQKNEIIVILWISILPPPLREAI